MDTWGGDSTLPTHISTQQRMHESFNNGNKNIQVLLPIENKLAFTSYHLPK